MEYILQFFFNHQVTLGDSLNTKANLLAGYLSVPTTAGIYFVYGVDGGSEEIGMRR